MIAESIVHTNISVSKLKALVKNFGQMRYVIDLVNEKIHAAHALNFIHLDIRENAALPYTSLRAHGYIEYTEEKGFVHRISAGHCPGDGYKSTADFYDYPLVSKIESAGISRSPCVLSFEW